MFSSHCTYVPFIAALADVAGHEKTIKKTQEKA
jgi:hypothetical protein